MGDHGAVLGRGLKGEKLGQGLRALADADECVRNKRGGVG